MTWGGPGWQDSQGAQDSPKERGGPFDVCLVAMPYAGPERPSMALGLLLGILARDGISATGAQANLWFAEKVGLHKYLVCSVEGPTDFLMGEWTFAAAAFPDSRDRDEEYLAQIAAAGITLRNSGRSQHSYGFGSDSELVDDLRSLRVAATEFADEAARRVLATGARVVGCTSTFEQQVASLALLRRVRELDPSVVTMLGGANCETVMGQAAHRCFPWVDYVVSGEADGLISGLMRVALEKGRDAEPGDLPAGVLGPCHRDGRGGHVPGAGRLPRALFRDLDSLPVPEFGDYFADLAGSPLAGCITPGLPLETSRGCWWGNRHQCTFCGLNGSSMAYHSKSAGRVLAEIEELERRHEISAFEVVDNILDMGYFKTLLPALAADPARRQLFYEVKANLTREQVAALVAAGVTWVQPGIESLHTAVLTLMDKGVRGWQNIQLLKWARELGLRISWSLLWGFPGEHDQYYTDMAAWFPLLEHLQAPQGVTCLRYDRFSVYHNQAKRYGLTLSANPAMAYVYPVPPADLDELAYFFTSEPRDQIEYRNAHGLDEQPGVAKVREAVRDWDKAFSSPRRPILSMRDRNGELDILDTRRCATAGRRTLTGLARAIVLACDVAPRPAQLSEIVRRDYDLDVTAAEVSDAVAALSADKLLLHIDGRLVGLAVSGVLPDLATVDYFPGGHINLAAAHEAERQLTAASTSG